MMGMVREFGLDKKSPGYHDVHPSMRCHVIRAGKATWPRELKPNSRTVSVAHFQMENNDGPDQL